MISFVSPNCILSGLSGLLGSGTAQGCRVVFLGKAVVPGRQSPLRIY